MDLNQREKREYVVDAPGQGYSPVNYSHEIILPNSDIPFKMFLFEGGEGNYLREKHWHSSIEIFALLLGELVFYLNGTEYLLKPGQFMLVNSNEVHSIIAKEKNTTVVLQIPPAIFERYYTDDEFIFFSHSAGIEDHEMMELVGDMYRTYVERAYGYEFKVQSLFYHLVYLLVTKYRETEVSSDFVKRSRKLDKLSMILSYMKENYEKDLDLTNLAGTFGYSPAYLSRMFRKYAGINYKKCLDQIRLEYAYRDLVNTDRGIGEIAMAHGFANSKAFTKIFEKKYGMLPSEYRKKINNCHDLANK